MLKILAFLLLIPCFAFSSQESIDRLNKKIYLTLKEIRDLSKDQKQQSVKYHFLCGKIDAYYEELNDEITCLIKKK